MVKDHAASSIHRIQNFTEAPVERVIRLSHCEGPPMAIRAGSKVGRSSVAGSHGASKAAAKQLELAGLAVHGRRARPAMGEAGSCEQAGRSPGAPEGPASPILAVRAAGHVEGAPESAWRGRPLAMGGGGP